ncbi:MAG: hypothetical protein WAW61_02175 [Methylococcaceae bacterium]
MTFEDYWKEQPKTLDKENNELMRNVAKHAWNKATEQARKECDQIIFEAISSLDSGVIIY